MNSLGFGLTNAQKGLIMAAINAGISLAVLFGWSLTGEQVAGVIAFVDAILALWIGLTAGGSPTLKEGKNALTGKDKATSDR
jgi:hypothetical protein